MMNIDTAYYRRYLLAAMAILLAAAVGLIFANPAVETPQPAPKAALTVTTTLPSLVEWPTLLTANGDIHAWREAIVSSEANGLRISEVLVDVGDHVHKGQELIRLQSDTVVAEYDQTRASLAEMEATLAEARANAERARQLEVRGALSAQQITQYLTGEQTAKARVEVLKARMKSDQLRLAQTHVLAPDEGTITTRTATLGTVTQPGQELFRLICRDRLEWRAELPAADLVRVKHGMKVRVTTASKGEVTGQVRLIAPTLDPRTRTGLVYVDLNNYGDARMGMFARGEIEIGLATALVLPQSAVMSRDGFSYVYRVGPDNRIIQTKVALGQRVGERIAILKGLDASAPVVSSGVGFLSDGDLVRLVLP
ncbi:RND transporter [Gammaproteobacteria bacterium]